nr:unnamed protein product [Callosobruchus analis]
MVLTVNIGTPAPSHQQQQQYYQQQQASPPTPSSVSLTPQASSSPLPSPQQPAKGWACVQSPVSTSAQPAWSTLPNPSPQFAWRAPTSTSAQPEYRPAPAPSSSSLASPPIYQPAAWKHPSKPVLPESEVNDSLPLWRKPTSTHYEAAHQPVSQQTYLGQQYLGDSQKNQKPQEKIAPSGVSQGQESYNAAHNLYQSETTPQPQQQNGYQAAQNQSNLNQYNQSNCNQYIQSNPYNRSQSTQSQSVHQYSQSESSQQGSQQYQPSAVQQRESSQYQTVQHYQSPGGQLHHQQSVQLQSYRAKRQYEVHTTQQYSSANPNVKSTQTIKEVKTESTPQGVQSVTQFSTISSNSPQIPLTESQLDPKSVAAPSQVAPRPQPKPVAPPPSTISLRPQVPISQVPAPLVTSQPATATLKVLEIYEVI